MKLLRAESWLHSVAACSAQFAGCRAASLPQHAIHSAAAWNCNTLLGSAQQHRMAKILCCRESCIPCHEGGPERTWACLERPQANACKSTEVRRGWTPHTASYTHFHALRLTCGLLAAASMFHAPKILAHNVCGLQSTEQHTMRSHAMTSHSKQRALLTRVHGVGEVSRVSSAGTRTGPSFPRTCLQPR